MQQELLHCHCYCARTMLPWPWWLALLPLVDCCFSKKIIPHIITGWTARLAAMHATIVPWRQRCHHCTNAMLTCFHWLVVIIAAGWLFFHLKICRHFCWQHCKSCCNAATIVPQPCCHFAMLALALVLFSLGWLFFPYIRRSWVPSCAASYCNAAAAMPLSLMQLWCCISLLAAWQHLLPTLLPQCHDAFSIKQSPGRCLLLGVMVVGVVAWGCGCNQQCCYLVLLLLPVSIACHCHLHPHFWHIAIHCHHICCPSLSQLLSIAITVAVHCHHHHHSLPLLPPSLLTVAITVDYCHHCWLLTVAISVTTSSLSHYLL